MEPSSPPQRLFFHMPPGVARDAWGANLVLEWGNQSPLPIVAIALIPILLGLRMAVPAAEKGRARAGIFFLGSYLASLPVLASLGSAGAASAYHAVRVVSVAFFAFAAVIASGMLLFDVLLARRTELPRILRDLVVAFVYLVIVFVILSRSGVNLTSIVTTSAVLTAVIGLALQETLGNIMAGLALQLENDFATGDWIRIDEKITGRIREVRWRATSLVTKNGDLVLVPNGVVARAILTNYSRPTAAHRQWVLLRMHFRYPPAQVREVVLDAVRSVAGIRADPTPDCLLMEFKEDSNTYACRYWIDDFQRDDPFDSEVRSMIWYALHRAGMEIPFPSHNVHMTEMNQDRAQRKADEEHARRMDALTRVDVFRGLDGEKVDRLARRLRLAIFGPGETIIKKGDPGDSLYILRTGQVIVKVAAADGREHEVATLSSGQFFGEMSLMTGEARAATVNAKTDAECYVVSKDAFREILEERPELAHDISEILSSRQITLEGVSTEVSRQRRETQRNQLFSRIAAFFGIGKS